MTEAEWLAGENPTPMLELLRGKVSNRRLRLFAVACCRHVWEWLLGYSREAVEVAERYADKQATRAEMFQAHRGVHKDFKLTEGLDGAMACAFYATTWGLWEAVTGVVRNASSAPRTSEWLRVVYTKRKTRAMHAAAGRAGERRAFQGLAPLATICRPVGAKNPRLEGKRCRPVGAKPSGRGHGGGMDPVNVNGSPVIERHVFI
jgi:hypothetical protein